MTSNAISHAPASMVNLFLLTLLALPLILDPAVSLSYDTIYLDPKVRWIYLVILPLSVAITFYSRKELFKFGIGFYFLALFSFWIMITGIFFHRNFTTWFGFSDRKDGIFMHLIYCMIALGGMALFRQEETHKNMRIFIKYTMIGSITLSLTNILQQLNLIGVLGTEAYEGVIATPFGGTLGHRGYMGGATALLLPILIWSQIHSLSKRAKILNTVAIVFTTWALAGSWSRGPWIAGILSIAWLLIFEKRLINLRIITSLFLGILLFFASALVPGSSARIFGQDGEVGITGSNGRNKMWDSAIRGVFQRPLSGWGSPALWLIMDTQSNEYLLPQSRDSKVRSVRRLSKDPGQAPSFIVEKTSGERYGVDLTMNKSHNEFIDYAATYGVPAFLIFSIIILFSIWNTRFSMPGISASLLSYAVYLSTWPETIRFAPIAWLIIGIAMASFGVNRAAKPAQRLDTKETE